VLDACRLCAAIAQKLPKNFLYMADNQKQAHADFTLPANHFYRKRSNLQEAVEKILH